MDEIAIKEAGRKSVKWSFFAEVLSKLSLPISTMFLARILNPEIYGIATAVTIIVSFCEIVLESGFAKYLIEHDFADEDDYKKQFSLLLFLCIINSLIVSGLIIIFRYPLSSLIGNSGYEIVLAASTIQIVFASLNALYSADLKRNFKFNKLFIVKIVYCFIPFLVTIPLALLGLNYWSLIIGAIAAQAVQLPILALLSKRSITAKFNIKNIGIIIRDSAPMILDSVVVWICSWLMTLLATQFFDTKIVGLIKVANSTVSSIFTLFSATFISVLFPTLSRLKSNNKEFEDFFVKTQKAAICILPPIGVGCFFFSGTITALMLGSKWSEASFMIGVFGLTKPLLICYTYFLSEAFRSKGYFYRSVFYQIFVLIIDLSLRLTIGRISLEHYIWISIVSDLLAIAGAIAILRITFKMSALKQITSLVPSFVCCVIFLPFVYVAQTYSLDLFRTMAQIFFCALVYFLAYYIIFKKLFFNALSYFKFGRNT
ncbi:MAG: oligosaccharide flippase family protein [Bacilli bacterium]|nr:oligosaccharide flippase family protein [Bacilli bacterium]